MNNEEIDFYTYVDSLPDEEKHKVIDIARELAEKQVCVLDMYNYLKLLPANYVTPIFVMYKYFNTNKNYRIEKLSHYFGKMYFNEFKIDYKRDNLDSRIKNLSLNSRTLTREELFYIADYLNIDLVDMAYHECNTLDQTVIGVVEMFKKLSEQQSIYSQNKRAKLIMPESLNQAYEKVKNIKPLKID